MPIYAAEVSTKNIVIGWKGAHSVGGDAVALETLKALEKVVCVLRWVSIISSLWDAGCQAELTSLNILAQERAAVNATAIFHPARLDTIVR